MIHGKTSGELGTILALVTILFIGFVSIVSSVMLKNHLLTKHSEAKTISGGPCKACSGQTCSQTGDSGCDPANNTCNSDTDCAPPPPKCNSGNCINDCECRGNTPSECKAACTPIPPTNTPIPQPTIPVQNQQLTPVPTIVLTPGGNGGGGGGGKENTISIQTPTQPINTPPVQPAQESGILDMSGITNSPSTAPHSISPKTPQQNPELNTFQNWKRQNNTPAQPQNSLPLQQVQTLNIPVNPGSLLSFFGLPDFGVLGNAISTGISGLESGVQNAINQSTSAVSNAASTVATGVTSRISDAFTGIQALGSIAAQSAPVSAIQTILTPFVSSIAPGGQFVANIVNNTTSVVTSASCSFSGVGCPAPSVLSSAPGVCFPPCNVFAGESCVGGICQPRPTSTPLPTPYQVAYNGTLPVVPTQDIQNPPQPKITLIPPLPSVAPEKITYYNDTSCTDNGNIYDNQTNKLIKACGNGGCGLGFDPHGVDYTWCTTPTPSPLPKLQYSCYVGQGCFSIPILNVSNCCAGYICNNIVGRCQSDPASGIVPTIIPTPTWFPPYQYEYCAKGYFEASVPSDITYVCDGATVYAPPNPKYLWLIPSFCYDCGPNSILNTPAPTPTIPPPPTAVNGTPFQPPDLVKGARDLVRIPAQKAYYNLGCKSDPIEAMKQGPVQYARCQILLVLSHVGEYGPMPSNEQIKRNCCAVNLSTCCYNQ